MTKNRKMVLGSVLLVGLATGVLSDDKSGTNMTAKPAKGPQPAVVGTKGPVRSDLPVIGYLEKRDRLITIKSSAKGTVYSVKTSDGKVLFENVSAEKLRAEAPEIHDLIKTGIAGVSEPAADARVRIKHDASLGNQGGR